MGKKQLIETRNAINNRLFLIDWNFSKHLFVNLVVIVEKDSTFALSKQKDFIMVNRYFTYFFFYFYFNR